MYDAAQRRAVTADEFRCGVHDNIRAVFQRTDEIRRAESIVNDKRQSVRMGDLRERVNVGNVAVRIA